MFLEQFSPDEFTKLMGRFNRAEFNTKDRGQLAKIAAQQQITITSKHHEDFAMFDTKLSDFSIMHSPFGRGQCRELAKECHRHGMMFSFYFPLMDWHWLLYRRSRNHGAPVSRESISLMYAQVREPCTDFGKLDALWFDGGGDHTLEQVEAQKLIDMVASSSQIPSFLA